ncbi:hypothetical protein CKO25_05650 [Thiocapsa imhoffii]|uniref:Uncharacterized protein n=1 Tax=Thiocapsa imhoffii TaxID=382777 RepID=A0A9X0WG85_9GAMM|nr:hypothetical protein [Thiocapsa imhoffii]
MPGFGTAERIRQVGHLDTDIDVLRPLGIRWPVQGRHDTACRTAASAARLHTAETSAPLKPVLPATSASTSMPPPNGLPRRWTLKISCRLSSPGSGMRMTWSEPAGPQDRRVDHLMSMRVSAFGDRIESAFGALVAHTICRVILNPGIFISPSVNHSRRVRGEDF